MRKSRITGWLRSRKRKRAMELMARIFGMVALASLALFGQTVRTAQKARPPEPPYLGASKSVEARVDDLIARMTIEEKASQMQNSAPAIPRLGIPSYDWWSEVELFLREQGGRLTACAAWDRRLRRLPERRRMAPPYVFDLAARKAVQKIENLILFAHKKASGEWNL